MKAVLEFDAPESCTECPLTHGAWSGDSHAELCCLKDKRPFIIANAYPDSRHPDCPLNIQQEGLRWIVKSKHGYCDLWQCEKCNMEFSIHSRHEQDNFFHCPSCGVKLDPPEEDKDD